MKKEKKLYISVSIAVVISVFVTFLCCVGPVVFSLIMVESVIPDQYVTTDLNDYGKYTGNINNEAAEKYITSFFPEKIEESFTDVTYEYRAQANDTYAFEAYLEFTIEDLAVFQSYVADNIGTNVSDFAYDPTFKEYVINDELDIAAPDSIRQALIGKILYSEEKQQIIYVAMGVYDGGVVKTYFLCHYFNRFGINPSKYTGQKGQGDQGQGTKTARQGTVPWQDRGRFRVLSVKT